MPQIKQAYMSDGKFARCNCCGEPIGQIAYYVSDRSPVYCSYSCVFFVLSMAENQALIEEMDEVEPEHLRLEREHGYWQ